MNQQMEALKERGLGWLIYGGVGGVVVGGMLIFLGLILPIAWLGWTLALLGGLAAVTGLVLGLHWENTAHTGAVGTHTKVRVISRSIYNDEMNLVDESFAEEFENVRYYVKLELGPNNRVEFETLPDVYFQCGEGMFGDAFTQGKWLGKFVPYVGPTHSTAYDNY